MQKIGNVWRPLAFFSKSLSPAQRKYSTFSRELLGLYLAVKHFRHYFEGNPDMVMYCDHEPLVKAFYSSTQRDNARECRHLSEIASLCTNLKYIKGVTMWWQMPLVAWKLPRFFNMLLRLTGMILQKLSKTTMS